MAEPALLPIVQTCRDGTNGTRPNLSFSTNIAQAIKEADLIFITVDTPANTTENGSDGTLDISRVLAVAEQIATFSLTDKIIVQKSTVPPGTSDTIKQILTTSGQPGIRFDVLSNPEFLAEGSAIPNLLQPDRVLIGSDQDVHGLQAARCLSSVYESWIPKDRIIFMNTASAELAKLAANALLAQRVSSINALSAICEEVGADVEAVATACGMDSRIGSGMLRASLGYGGSCFGKDVLALSKLSDDLGLCRVGSYWRSSDEINEFQKSRFTARVLKGMEDISEPRMVAVLGCSYKQGTDDVRGSPAVSLLAALLIAGAQVAVYDPMVQCPQLLKALSEQSRPKLDSDAWKERLSMCSTAYVACGNAHAIVIATDWDEFSNRKDISENIFQPPTSNITNGNNCIDWQQVASSMQYPKLFFDGRNVVDDQKLQKLGFDVHMIGKVSCRKAQAHSSA